MTDQAKDVEVFRLFRGSDAAGYSEIEEVVETTPIVAKGLEDFYAAGGGEGVEVRLLYAGNGQSLVYAWFKSGFPLARHTHNVDCLYYILSGTVKVGTETLAAGDGFFVGKDVPYAHVAGEGGVELVEFRTAESFNTKFLGAQSYWDRALATVADSRGKWAAETKPSLAEAKA